MGHNSAVSGHPKSTGIPRVDRLSTGVKEILHQHAPMIIVTIKKRNNRLNKTSFRGYFEPWLQSGKSFHLVLIPDVDTGMTYAKKSKGKLISY